MIENVGVDSSNVISPITPPYDQTNGIPFEAPPSRSSAKKKVIVAIVAVAGIIVAIPVLLFAYFFVIALRQEFKQPSSSSTLNTDSVQTNTETIPTAELPSTAISSELNKVYNVSFGNTYAVTVPKTWQFLPSGSETVQMYADGSNGLDANAVAKADGLMVQFNRQSDFPTTEEKLISVIAEHLQNGYTKVSKEALDGYATETPVYTMKDSNNTYVAFTAIPYTNPMADEGEQSQIVMLLIHFNPERISEENVKAILGSFE